MLFQEESSIRVYYQILNVSVIFRKMRSHRVRTEKQRMPLLITSKVNAFCKGYFGNSVTCLCAPRLVVLCSCINYILCL